MDKNLIPQFSVKYCPWNLIRLMLLVLTTLNSWGQPTDAISILKQLNANLNEKNIFTYDCQYRIKYFDNSDTTQLTNYSCIVMKAPADTILTYYAKVFNKNEERIYDGVNFYLFWHNEKKIVKDIPAVTGKGFISNNIKRQHIPGIFFNESAMETYLNSKEITMEEVIINRMNCWRISVALPTDEEITYFKRILYLNKKTLLPIKIESFARYQDVQDEYWELRIQNLSIARKTATNFTDFYSYPVGYSEEQFKAPKINYDLLATGTQIIPFEGTLLTGGPFKIENIKNSNLVLLDFWYVACPPCIRAMPHLATLHEKYKTQGLEIIGLNSMDNPKDKKDVIQKLLNRFDARYQIVFIDKKVADSYLIKVYPSIYLIKGGKILHSLIGYSEESINELDDIIKLNLSK